VIGFSLEFFILTQIKITIMGKNCPKCNILNRDDSLFCSNCGQKFISILEESLEARNCPLCGARLIDPLSSYCPKCLVIVNPAMVENTQDAQKKQFAINQRIELKKKEELKKIVKLQLDKAKENIAKLQDSGNLILIDNYVKKFPNYPKGTVKFENLRDLLKSKQFDFNKDELETIIHLRQSNLTYKEVKAKIFAKAPTNADECLRNYLLTFNKDVNNSMIRKILVDQFSYNGEIEKDIARIRVEMTREKSENELIGFESELLTDAPTYNQITIRDIDLISGYDFELLLKKLFEGMGYQVAHTSFSNDQGADLILEKDGTRSVIQAKNWTANVGNTAIQEVVAAIKHYQAHRALVISSSGFTQSAIELARSNNVELWDRAKLNTILNDNPVLKK
jgi:restriction system protein